MITQTRRRALRTTTAAFLLGASLMATNLAGSLAAQAEPLKVVGFAGASNWPFWVGQEKGFFAKEQIEATFDITPNSVEMAKNLNAGKYDLAFSSVDNIVAYDEGQGEAKIEGPVSFVSLFGVDNGLLSLMATPDIKDIKDLKGKTVSVDAMTTGYAFVQRELLANHGVAESDVTWTKVGGGAQRLEALMKKEQSATLLNTPLDLAAESKGFVRLIRAKDELGGYQGIVAAVKKDAIESKRALYVRFIRGFHASVNWLADPANKDEALALLMGKMRTMDRDSGEKAYVALLDPKDGIYRNLKISRDGMKTVLRLRSKYAEPQKTLTNPEAYIDESLLAEAMKKPSN